MRRFEFSDAHADAVKYSHTHDVTHTQRITDALVRLDAVRHSLIYEDDDCVAVVLCHAHAHVDQHFVALRDLDTFRDSNWHVDKVALVNTHRVGDGFRDRKLNLLSDVIWYTHKHAIRKFHGFSDAH